jgi:hypothetical protein
MAELIVLFGVVGWTLIVFAFNVAQSFESHEINNED